MVLSSLSLLPCPRMSPRLSVQCLQDRSRQLEVEAAWQELTVGQNSQTYNIPKIIRNISWNNTTASRSSWRRKCGTQSCAVTRPTTPDNVSLSSSTITLRSGCLCVVCDVWCVMCDVWCVMCDVWCVMCCMLYVVMLPRRRVMWCIIQCDAHWRQIRVGQPSYNWYSILVIMDQTQ